MNTALPPIVLQSIKVEYQTTGISKEEILKSITTQKTSYLSMNGIILLLRMSKRQKHLKNLN